MLIGDYPLVSELWKSSDGVVVRTSDSQKGIEQYLARNPNMSFIAADDDEIVGSIVAGHDGKRGYIQHLIVLSTHRSSGIGSRLVALSVEALSDIDIYKSHIHVLVDNKVGNNFWSKQGWDLREDIAVYSHLNTTDKNA